MMMGAPLQVIDGDPVTGDPITGENGDVAVVTGFARTHQGGGEVLKGVCLCCLDGEFCEG